MSIGVQDIVNYALRDERDNREHKEQRHWYISRLGSCPTGQYLERMGKQPDKSLTDRELGVFKAGDLFEEYIVSKVAQAKIWAECEYDTQVHVENEALDVSGYIDLVIKHPNGAEVPYEIKSKHSKAFWYMQKENQPMRHHAIQLWTYMYLKKLPLGVIVYVSKDDLAIKEYVVELADESLRDETMATLKLLNEAWQTQQVPECTYTDPKDWHAKYCSWHEQCMEYARENELSDTQG